VRSVIDKFTVVSSIDMTSEDHMPDAFDFLRESYGFGELLTCGTFTSHMSYQSDLRGQMIASTESLIDLFVKEFV